MLNYPMKFVHITIGQGLLILALLLAFALRFADLGAAPLSDFEADRALQALGVSNGTSGDMTPGPAYALLTGIIFFLFGDDNVTARALPAIAGILLLSMPFILRSRLGSRIVIILAFGLALDPGLVVLSRLAGSSMLAAGFGLLAFGLACSSRPVLAGVFGGLALLSGPEALHGLLSIGLAGGLGYLLTRQDKLEPLWIRSSETLPGSTWRSGLLAAFGMVVFAGTLLLRFPDGLGSFGGILPAYLNG